MLYILYIIYIHIYVQQFKNMEIADVHFFHDRPCIPFSSLYCCKEDFAMRFKHMNEKMEIICSVFYKDSSDDEPTMTRESTSSIIAWAEHDQIAYNIITMLELLLPCQYKWTNSTRDQTDIGADRTHWHQLLDQPIEHMNALSRQLRATWQRLRITWAGSNNYLGTCTWNRCGLVQYI